MMQGIHSYLVNQNLEKVKFYDFKALLHSREALVTSRRIWSGMTIVAWFPFDLRGLCSDAVGPELSLSLQYVPFI